MAGRTFCVMTSRGTFDGRTLRAKRWLQERRQCARSARITIFSVAQEPRNGESGEELSRHMVWLRITLPPGTPDATAWPITPRAQEQGAAAGIRFQGGLKQGKERDQAARAPRSLVAV
jgi:hypothetical protein